MWGLDLVVLLNFFKEPESKCVNATSPKRPRMKLKAEVMLAVGVRSRMTKLETRPKDAESAWYLYPISSSSGTLSRETTGGACGRKLREESNNAQHVQNSASRTKGLVGLRWNVSHSIICRRGPNAECDQM